MSCRGFSGKETAWTYPHLQTAHYDPHKNKPQQVGRSSKVSGLEEQLTMSQINWHSPWHHPSIGDGLQSWDPHLPFLPTFCQGSFHWQSWLRTPPKVQMLLEGSKRVAWSPSASTARVRGNPYHLRMEQMFPKLNYPPANPREGGEHHFGSPSLDFERTVLSSALLPLKIHTILT